MESSEARTGSIEWYDLSDVEETDNACDADTMLVLAFFLDRSVALFDIVQATQEEYGQNPNFFTPSYVQVPYNRYWQGQDGHVGCDHVCLREVEECLLVDASCTALPCPHIGDGDTLEYRYRGARN